MENIDGSIQKAVVSVPHFERLEMADLIELGKSDYFFFNLESMYFIDGLLDFERLKESFETEVLKKFPLISSITVGERFEDEKEVWKEYKFKIVSPSNVTFTFKVIDDKSFELYKKKPYGKRVIRSIREGFELESLIDRIPLRPYEEGFDEESIYRKALENTPNSKFTVMHTKNTRKSILAISMDHSLTDLTGLTNFVIFWSLCYRKLGGEDTEGVDFDKIQFPFSRKLYFADQDFDVDKYRTSEYLGKYGTLFPRDMTDAGSLHCGTFEKHPNDRKCGEWVVLHFTSDRILELKSLVKAEEGQIFSSYDCITAHMWKIQALKESKNSSDVIPCSIIVNMRGRAKGLTPNFFGNSLLTPSLELTREEVLKSDMTTLVLKIRRVISSMDEKDCYVHSNLNYHFDTEERKRRICVDDWRQLYRRKPNFGANNRCERVALCPPYDDDLVLLNWCFVRVHDFGDGLTVDMGIRKEFLDLVGEDLDLTDPDCIHKILKLQDV